MVDFQPAETRMGGRSSARTHRARVVFEAKGRDLRANSGAIASLKHKVKKKRQTP